MNRRTLAAVVAAVALALSASAGRAAEYRIDPAHSFVQFRISHLGFSWMIGTFDKVSGGFIFDPAAGPAGQKISVEIDTASVDTSHAERDKHLRSADFLNVRKFPKATYVSTGYEGDARGGTMKGQLTLMGVTRPVAVAVRKVGEGKDPWGGYRAGFEGTATLNRRAFGAGMNLGPAPETVHFFLSVEGIRN